MPEVIEEVNSSNNKVWEPCIGEEVLGLLKSKGFQDKDGGALNESGQKILGETNAIMKACVDPVGQDDIETGIVIGYVQSGKTLSFTTLTALARDNGFRIVIIIAGTSVNLVNQSTERLKSDLRLDKRQDRKWTLLSNPSRIQEKETIETALSQWNDTTYSNDRCRTVLITVMKNKDTLGNIIDVFKGLELQNVPVLIIDDEGDQASLTTTAKKLAKQKADYNNLTESDVSRIYREITTLRSLVPHHTFLQYTATPQAILFINIVDRLSPNFVKLLTPGKEYTGGKEFFINNPNLIREIPANDIPSNNNPLDGPPGSLIRALRTYFLGVVAGDLSGSQGNRTMLIHPSRLQVDHNIYQFWVKNICRGWQRLLEGDDEEEKDLLLKEFKQSYDDLRITLGNSLPDFSSLTGPELIHAIKFTQIVEVNSRNGSTPPINWQDLYSWILVGGQSMDRGFTVEGLTVTYMPRSLGGGNVDTVQQRARFFGYKRSYLGYCRIYLDQITIDAYNAIVEHEENVRNSLEEFDINNKDLNGWYRHAVLDRMLSLTRSNVLYDRLKRDMFEDWFKVKAPHDTESLIALNNASLFEFLRKKESIFSVNEGHPNRTEVQKHLVARISMQEALEQLLNKLKFTLDSDSANYSILRSMMKHHLKDNPNEECLIYLMSARSLDNWTKRVRRQNKKNNEVQQLFQGKNPKSGAVIYPGDSEIKDKEMLTIQIHILSIKDTNYDEVPTLAISIPQWLNTDTIHQVKV